MGQTQNVLSMFHPTFLFFDANVTGSVETNHLIHDFVIQRPQSIYLFLSGVLNLIIFWTPIYSRAVADPSLWIGNGFAISLTIVMITSFVAIFLYKNRVFQLKVVKFATYIQIVAFGFATGILFTLGGFGTFLWREGIGIILIAFVLLLLWMAGKGIKKDDELVKSMDRIR